MNTKKGLAGKKRKRNSMSGTVIEHLEELRVRLILVIISFVVLFIIGFGFSNLILAKIRSDFINKSVELVASTPVEFFIAKLNVGFLTAIVLIFPVFLYELLVFLKPAMTKIEKGFVILFLPFSLLLFVFGVIFSYSLFLKLAVLFLSQLSARASVLNLWSINRFVSFVFLTCLVFGLIFQLPVIVLLLSKLNLLDARIMRHKRKYFILLVFVMAALITPPDPLTQLLLALPLLLLYELSIFLVAIFKKKQVLG